MRASAVGLLAALTGSVPVAGMADDVRAYIGSGSGIIVLDTATNGVVAKLGTNSGVMALTPDGTTLYANTGDGLHAIDTTTHAFTPVPMSAVHLEDAAVAPDGLTLYGPDSNSYRLLAVDTTTNTLIDRIDVGSPGVGIAITADSAHAYVTTGRNIPVVDLRSRTVATTITEGLTSPFGITILPDGSRVFVAEGRAVTVIDPATNAVAGAVDVGPGWKTLTPTPDGSRIFMVNNGSRLLGVIDARNNTFLGTVDVGSATIDPGNPAAGKGSLYDVAVTPDGSRVYVSFTHPRAGVVIVDAAAAVSDPVHAVVQTLILDETGYCCGYIVIGRVAGGAALTGDCNGDGQVIVTELITGVNIALGILLVNACPAFDVNGDGAVTVNELIRGVTAALGP